jgi:hypothetical protein
VPQGRELVYSPRISLDRTQMQVEDKGGQPRAGHGGDGRDQEPASARIIKYLLSPRNVRV